MTDNGTTTAASTTINESLTENESPTECGSGRSSIERHKKRNTKPIEPNLTISSSTASCHTSCTMSRQNTTKESIEAKRERKAAKTLAIITGVFVICWLPYFILAVLRPISGEPNAYISYFAAWLGFVNSMLNPIIYTIFSPDFRAAFERILLGRKVPRSPCNV